MTEKLNLPLRLLEAADNLEKVPLPKLQELLREASLALSNLQGLLGISDETEIEDTQPEGPA
jgi:hypothetical protein